MQVVVITAHGEIHDTSVAVFLHGNGLTRHASRYHCHARMKIALIDAVLGNLKVIWKVLGHRMVLDHRILFGCNGAAGPS